MKKLIFILIFFTAVSAYGVGNWGGGNDNRKLDKDGDDALIITAPDATTTPITINAAPGQTADLFKINDSDGSNLFEIFAGGGVSNLEGIRTVTSQYGAGLGVQLFGENDPDHVNQLGWYDHTGGTFEETFHLTSGDLFTQADTDNGSHILITGYSGAFPLAEIKTFISGSEVIVEGYGWDQDFGSSGSPLPFLTIKHPSFVSGDGAKHEFSAESCGEVEIVSYDYDCDDFLFEVEHDAAASGVGAALIESNLNGHFVPSVLAVSLVSGDLGPNNRVASLVSAVNTSAATTADDTTRVASFVALAINGSDARKIGYSVQPGFDDAFIVSGAEPEDPTTGYDVTSSVVTDRVTGTPQDGTAFLDTSTTGVTLFTSLSDYILIGSAATFEVIDVTLGTDSSKDISPLFEYSTGNGTWSTLSVLNDNTIGFQGSGQISFDAPGDWATGNETEAPGDITAAYYVRITRTIVGAIPTLPVEAHFKTFADLETGMEIDGRGFIQPLSHPDAGAPNNSIYYSTTQSKLVYKDSGGVVNDLY